MRCVDMQDADECIRLAPTWAKGYSRKGHLQFFMKEHEKALKTYEEGLAADPTNEELRDGVQRCYEAISKVCAGPYDGALCRSMAHRAGVAEAKHAAIV